MEKWIPYEKGIRETMIKDETFFNDVVWINNEYLSWKYVSFIRFRGIYHEKKKCKIAF